MRKIKPINGHAMPSDMPEVYPSFHLDETQLPEIRDWKIGEEYTIQRPRRKRKNTMAKKKKRKPRY